MPHISAKPHRERMARAELGRHLCSTQWLNTWTCENGLQQCGAWSGRPQGSPPRSTPLPPLQWSAGSSDPFVLIVRAGAVWSGVGTLAVALGGGRQAATKRERKLDPWREI